MRWYRFLLILLTISGAVLLTGALRGPGSRLSSVEEPAAPDFSNVDRASVDPTATSLVDHALAGVSEPTISWLEAAVWMRAHLPDLSFEAEGSYLRAPGQRFRLELHTHLAGEPASRRGRSTGATTLAISDGRDMWTASRVASEGWKDVTRLQLSAILQGSDSPVSLPQVRSEFLSGPALRGVETMLRSLHGHFEWVAREDVQGDIRLTGRWKKSFSAHLAPSNQPWPEALPRVCRLLLRGANLWPARIELWGPTEDNGPDRLLIEVEFRDPVFDKRLPDDLLASLFAFDPGAAKVEDLTQAMRFHLTERTKQLQTAHP